jgi:hypothetical protein
MIVIPVDIILGTPIEPILAFLPAARVLVPRAGLAFVWGLRRSVHVRSFLVLRVENK